MTSIRSSPGRENALPTRELGRQPGAQRGARPGPEPGPEPGAEPGAEPRDGGMTAGSGISAIWGTRSGSGSRRGRNRGPREGNPRDAARAGVTRAKLNLGGLGAGMPFQWNCIEAGFGEDGPGVGPGEGSAIASPTPPGF